MDIYVNVVCTLSYLGAMHTKSNCLTLRTTEKLIAETMETDSDVTITSTAQPRSTLTNGDCQWRFADDRQYLYRRTTQVGWSTTDWPTSQITKMAISPDFCGAWTCSVDTQRFLDSGEWKDLSSLGQGVDDDIFAIAYRDTINEGNCTRQWFVKWNYTTAVSRLGPLIFQLGVICTSVGGHTETGCLVLKTEGTHQQPQTTTSITTIEQSTLSDKSTASTEPTRRSTLEKSTSRHTTRTPTSPTSYTSASSTHGSTSDQVTTPSVPIATTDVETVSNCGSDGSCQGQSNVTNNTSAWVRELQTFLKQSVPAGDAISMVLNRLRSVKIILSGDIITIVRMLSTLVEIQERQLQTVPQEERRGIATNFTQAMIQCGSIVLKEKYRQAWNDVPSGDKPQLAASLSDSLEKSGILMAKTVPSETFSISEENVVMDIVRPSTGNATYPNLTKVGNSSQWSQVIDRITLPPVDRQVVVALYNTLGDYFNTRPGEKIVNSRVISATLVNSSSTEAELGGNVTITLGHTKQDETVNLSTSSCSFWDQSRRNWSTEGCTARVSDDNHTICECNHLTNFAILVDVIGHEDEFALHVITYIGCIISIFCLIFCIFVFLGSRRVRCPRTIILANLCVCLLVAEVVFVAAVDKTQNKDVCTGIAIALHYLFLTVFAWMCVEGIELYVLLVRVFNLKSSRMVYYYLIGYGTPGVVVAISVTINYLMKLDGYVTEKYCWLAVKNYFIFSFVGPMLFIILVNIGFLIMTLKIIHTKRSTRKSDESRGKKMRHWVRVSLSLICVLGVTWVIGMLYIDRETIVFAYAFAIINSLQGLFILIFHCLLNEKVQDEMIRGISGKRKSPHSMGSITTFRRTLGSFSSTSLHAWKTPHSTTVTSYPRTLQGTRLSRPVVISRVQLPKQHY
ncbi:adhesion G protein-coupled receptor L3-like isoform X2 [Branchiostoma floridae x Branchiostoma belcheri]